jgi:hypothetical protein
MTAAFKMRLRMPKSNKQAQALAIKISRERRAGKEIPPPPEGRYSAKSKQRALRDLEVGRRRKRLGSAKKRPAKKRGRKRSAKKRSAKKR